MTNRSMIRWPEGHRLRRYKLGERMPVHFGLSIWRLFLLPFFVVFIPVTLASPYVPASDDVVLEQVPLSRATGARKELRRLRIQLTRDPDNLQLASQLARRYIEWGSARSDPRFIGYAQAALAPWWDLPRPPVTALILRAMIRQQQHEFGAALADLDQALRRDPTRAQAWLLRATVLTVRGDYPGARKSCQALLGLSSRLVTTACITSVTGVTGQAAKSYTLLSNVLKGSAKTSPGVSQWSHGILAELAHRLDRNQDAEKHYQQALAIDANDSFALAAYSDFLLDYGRHRAVVDLLSEHTRDDGLLLRLAIAEKALKAPALTTHVRTLRERFAIAERRGTQRHLRELSRFALDLLDQPDTALALAIANWETQREPTDAQLILRAALAANQPQAAVPVRRWLRQTGLEDSRLTALQSQLTTTVF